MIKKTPAANGKTRKQTTTKNRSAEELLRLVELYETKFGEIDQFLDFVAGERETLNEKRAELEKAEAAYKSLKIEVKAIEDTIGGAKDSLFRLLSPGSAKFMPLFDRMEKADPEVHGENAAEWRKMPIAALRLSSVSQTLLIDADVVAVGQLQDRVLEHPNDWHQKIEGLTEAVAAAIVDKLNQFIFDQERGR